MFSKNIFINYIKRLLVRRVIKRRVEALERIKVLKEIRALSLLILDLLAKPWPTNSSCFIKLAKKLTQKF